MAKARKLIFAALIVFCFAVMVFGINTADIAHAYGLYDVSEENSPQNPYLIATAEDMNELSAQVLAGNSQEGNYFRLAGDIVLDPAFNPIGNPSNQFKGIFDGDDFTITINITKTTSYNGIFGAIGANGGVRNLRVGGTVTGANNTGSIAGVNYGFIENSINYSAVSANDYSAEGIGGIAGLNYGRIENCINMGTVRGNKYVGGIAGTNATTGSSLSILNGIINLGDLTYHAGYNSYIIGGLVGQNDGIVKNGYNYALVTHTGDQIGSLIGYFSAKANLAGSKNCYNNIAKSATKVIGVNAQMSAPANFTNYTKYDFLGRTQLVFDAGVMSVREFDIGFGYFPMLTAFVTESAITQTVRQLIFESGSGTETDPFVISNSLQWDLFATNTLIHDYRDVYVRLNTDIAQSTPLSNADNHFNGVFDGNNRTISLTLTGSDFVGMFRYIGAYGVVKNLNLTGWVSASGSYAGSVAGLSSGSIQYVRNSARIVASSYVGGIAGQVYNANLADSFVNVSNSGAVEGNGMLGGIAGYAYNAKTSGAVTNSGTVTQSGLNTESYFGGIFARIENSSTITYTLLLNSGVVNARQGNYAGGIAGSAANAEIKGSMNIGAVSGLSYVGGLVGYLTSGSFNGVGAVLSVTGASYTSGLAGAIGSNVSITDSYFSGNFHKMARSAILPETFRVIAYNGAYSLTLTNVYYNSDLIDAEGIEDSSLLIPELQGQSANYIQLTDVNGAAHSVVFSSTEYWIIEPKTLAYGYYPVSGGFDTATLAIIKNAVKYNYFNLGNGTESMPFTLTKAQHLYNLSYLHNNYAGYENLYYRQAAHITLDATLAPIGNAENPFEGRYYGDYYKINDLRVLGSASSYYGLFGSLSGAYIEKVAISGGVTGIGYLGAIAGYAFNSTIKDSYSLAEITANGDSYAGGLVGYLTSGTIENSFNAGRVSSINLYAGGIAGYSEGTIRRSFNMGMVTVVGTDSAAGGITGRNAGGSISGCYNSGTVKTVSDGYVGGLSGRSEGTIVNSYAIARVLYSNVSKAGALSGKVNMGVTNYLANSYYNIDMCALSPHSDTSINSPYAKTTTEMEATSFIDGFSESGLYQLGLAPGQDSRYAPRLTVFVSGGNADIEKYSALSARLRLFGWDDESTAAWGSVSNPYLIATRAQLVSLSALSATYDYRNYYFALQNDIDMRVGGTLAAFNPIGNYTDAHTYRAFNGTLDGKGFTIRYLSISSTVDYVGLVSYLGEYGTVKNLIIDANSVITTTGKYVGSFVGRNVSTNGSIDRCVSYAQVTGATNVGGIVGYTYQNTRITNCLFNGTVTGSSVVYGVVGMATGSASNVTTTNTWYITSLQSGYLNNGFNSTLFVDRNGGVQVTVNPNADISGFIVFTLVPDAHFRGYYMDVNNNVLSSDYDYPSVNNTSLNSIYARFTLPVSVNVTGGAGIVSTEGAGDYYCGQTVSIRLDFIQYGYFVNIFDFALSKIKDEYLDYTLRNDGEKILITFTMPFDFEDMSLGKVVNVQLMDAASYVTLTAPNTVYSGNVNAATATVNGSGNGYFDNIALRYYYGPQANYTENTANAGGYEVRAMLTVDDEWGLNGFFAGIISTTFTVSPKTLTVITPFNWAGIASKEYDALNYKNLVAVNNNIDGIITSDLNNLYVFCTIYWSVADAGEGLDVRATNFTLGGNAAANYSITYAYETFGFGQGVISPKSVTVTIASSNLTHTYNNMKPVISDISVSGSLGAVTLDFSFTLVDEEGDPVEGWLNTWNAGRYLVSVSTANTNYVVGLTQTYYLRINPIVITSVSYSGQNNLTYNGNNLAPNISGTYSTLYSGIDVVKLTYYYYLEPSVARLTVIDAGQYTAVPSVGEGVINYVLSPSVNNLVFTVNKAVRSSELEIIPNALEISIGEGNIPLTVNNAKDGTLIVNKINPAHRGRVELVQNGLSFELMPTAYGTITFTVTETNCRNYTDSTSGEITLTINPKTIYVGIKNRTWYYGDVITPEFQYSEDIEQNDVLTPEEFALISAFVAPVYRIPAQTLSAGESYEVKILGGQSDNCRFYTASTNFITIIPRPIEIIVTAENTNNIKIYGDTDSEISYEVKDLISGYIISKLPNGMPIEISGSLARTSGERAGLYPINEGTISSANNTDYDISFNIIGVYEITARPIKLYMPYYSKNYGEQDPAFTLAVSEGYYFVGSDNIYSVYVNIIRAAGESIGFYNYNLIDYSGGNNYDIIAIDIETRFEITYAVPTISIMSVTPIEWGETLSTSAIFGSASHRGRPVDGTFRWVNGNTQIKTVTTMDGLMYYQAEATFTPDDTNIRSMTIGVSVPVEKRKLGVSYAGKFDYTYTGRAIAGEYTLRLDNVISGTTPSVRGVIQGEAKNVGEYQIIPELTNDWNGVYELDTGIRPAILKIYPAIITVTVDGGEITSGENFTPVIRYAGFVEGESESALTTPASVGTVPREVGYYTLTPSGATAQNYTFVYYGSALIIRKAEVVAENVKLKGNLPPEANVSAKNLDASTLEYGNLASTIDKANGYSFLKPNRSEMVEYLKFDIIGTLDSSTEYEIRLASAIDESATLYIINSDGSIKLLEDYTLNEGTISFKAGNIKGVAVYTQKGILDMIKGYLPLVGGIAGVALIVGVSIYISSLKRKVERARREMRLR